MTDYEKEYEQYSQTNMSRGQLIALKCLKYAARGLIFGIIALVLWRVLFSGHVPKNMETLTVNDALYDAYVESGDELTMYTQTRAPVVMEGETAGYFWVCQTVFIPEANQVQVLIRYNNSTLKHIAQDFSLGEDEIPSREDTVVDVTLALAIDPDPTNSSTADREILRIHPSGEPTEDSTAMYNYRRYVFDNVDVDTAALINISVDFYYIGNVKYDRTPYSSIVIYEPVEENDPMGINEAVKLTARDKRALAAYGEAR